MAKIDINMKEKIKKMAENAGVFGGIVAQIKEITSGLTKTDGNGEEIISSLSTGFNKLQFGSKSQLAFLEDLNTLVADGIPPNRAIEMMVAVTTGISRQVALSISRKLAEGQPLAEGMREWFNISIIEIIRVGEEGGALAETMRSAISALSQRTSTWGAFIGGITYPLIVIIMACGITVYLDSSVLVQFKQIKPMDQWPEAGRELVGLADLVRHWWWGLLLTIGVVVVVMRKVMSTYVGELRPLLDKMPPFSLYRRFVAARFMETLGLLVSNGVVFKSALKVMQYQANPYIVSHLLLMEHLLGMGRGNIADVLSTGLIDEEDVMRLRVMAEVKGFEHGLTRMGVRGSEKSAKTLKFISKVVGGVLLVIGFAMILIIVRGLMLTGMSMGS